MNGVKLSISMDGKQVDRFIRLLTTEYSNSTWCELSHSLVDAGLLFLEKGGDKPVIMINSYADKLLDDYMYRKMAQPMTPFGLSCVVNELICKCVENESKELKDAVSSVLKKGGGIE